MTATSRVGIIGTGISGLTLALTLQQRGVETTLYAERSADELRAMRLPNTVIRYGPTIPRERGLGVDHWEGTALGVERIYFSVTGTPIAFAGRLPEGGSSVDFRVYLPRLLEDYESRGGAVVVGDVPAERVPDLAAGHELVVIATGRERADAFFARDPARSPYPSPQRHVWAGFWHGIVEADPPGVTYALVPGVGEIFQAPFWSSGGQVSNVLFEGLPGGPLTEITDGRWDDAPDQLAEAALRLLREHAPRIADRVDENAFRLTGPTDFFRGAVTPTVRNGWCQVAPDRFAVALGDAWVVNDPVTGQGANLGSACADVLAAMIVGHQPPFDEAFCRDVEDRLWRLAEPTTRFTNAFLGPPPPHVLDLLGAASADPAVADAFVANFADPACMWDAIGTPEGAERFRRRVGSRNG
jgi:hypothetical protein